MKSKVISAAVLLSLIAAPLTAAADVDKLRAALEARHVQYTIEDLEKLAGGQDQLIEQLMSLHSDVSYVEPRCVKILMHYANRPSVESALNAQIENPETAGLAQMITLHIDKVPDSAARARLAQTALSRAKSDPNFARYARNLESSKDAEVRRMAREQLGD